MLRLNFNPYSFLKKQTGSICTFLLVLIFGLITTQKTFAQTNCEIEPCAPGTVSNGPDPCAAKVYCSNSGVVPNGLINCTPSADTDGCGVDASDTAVPTGTLATFLDNTIPENCYSLGDNVQWIKYWLPTGVNSVKIQGSGQLDAWAVFRVPGEYTVGCYGTDPAYACQPGWCDIYNSDFLIACSDMNQWEIVTNLESNPAYPNLYLIALIYDEPSQGTINFKTKECQTICEIECPDDLTVDCADPTVPTFTGYPTYPANCDNICEPVTFTYSDVSTQGTDPNACSYYNYTITRTWTATSPCGGPLYCTQVITVHDITAPVITCPTVTSPIECPATPSFPSATATDNCDQSVSITHNDVTTPGTCPQEYSVTRTWTATDACGNHASCSQTISVTDNTAPMIMCADDASIECPATPVFPAPTVSDVCDPAPVVTFTDVTTPGSCPQEYSVTRTWTATDACWNHASCSQTISVTDNTPPEISCPTVSTPIECPAEPSFPPATATDACDASVTITYNDVTTPGDCPQEYSVTRTWTAKDDCLNASTCSRTIYVTDNTAPYFTFEPPNATVPCGGSTAPSATGWATAADLCGEVEVTYEDVAVPGNCTGNVTITRTWTATDDCDNSSTYVQTITIDDCFYVNLIKKTDGMVDPTKDWSFTLSGGGLNVTESTLGQADGKLFETIGPLSKSHTYTICETNIPAGWTSMWKVDRDNDLVAETIIAPYNPDASQNQDLGKRCYEFGADLPDPASAITCVLVFEVDNSYPGGEPRTPGYWKNWSSCTGGGQYNNAIEQGGCAAGYCTLDELLNDPGFVWCDISFGEGDCLKAVSILDQRDIVTGKKMASDAAYTLAMSLLAAQLNFAAGAEICPETSQAAIDAQQLLCDVGFDGSGNFLKSKHPQYAYALCLAACLDSYNNGYLCPSGDCNCSHQPLINHVTEQGTGSADAEILVYPNPSSGDVTIRFTVPENDQVIIDIYNLRGELVDRVFEAPAMKDVKNYVTLDRKALENGTYYYMLYTGKKSYQGKFVILK